MRFKPICVFHNPLWQDGVYGQTAPSASYPDLEGGTHSQAFSAKESAAGEAIQEIQAVGRMRKVWLRMFSGSRWLMARFVPYSHSDCPPHPSIARLVGSRLEIR